MKEVYSNTGVSNRRIPIIAYSICNNWYSQKLFKKYFNRIAQILGASPRDGAYNSVYTVMRYPLWSYKRIHIMYLG